MILVTLGCPFKLTKKYVWQIVWFISAATVTLQRNLWTARVRIATPLHVDCHCCSIARSRSLLVTPVRPGDPSSSLLVVPSRSRSFVAVIVFIVVVVVVVVFVVVVVVVVARFFVVCFWLLLFYAWSTSPSRNEVDSLLLVASNTRSRLGPATWLD